MNLTYIRKKRFHKIPFLRSRAHFESDNENDNIDVGKKQVVCRQKIQHVMDVIQYLI